MTGFGEALATTALKSTSGPATKALTSWGRRKFDRFLVTYTKTFSESVQKSIAKCAQVRNVLYRNQSASTDEKYVSISFHSPESKEVSDEQIIAALTLRRKVLLRGRGGAGKTMFTKWCVLRLAERFDTHQQIPVYVELREIKDRADAPLEQILFNQITSSRSKNTYSQFVEGLSIGLFVFILDAADEINKSDRSEICKKILDFRHTFPECGILLTSRDFEEIDALRGFERFSTRSLYKKEAISILEKLDYDTNVKDALIKEIGKEKTERHAFFLENPLMVTIMLLTYDQSKDIPTKRSAFYRRAFEALYERHDASKGIYRRDHHAGLPMDEFEAVFATFCYGTYTNGTFQIPESDLVPLFARACKIAEIDENSVDIAKDAHESACLIVKEGHDYVFCHRSFQEYFTAVYLRDYRSSDIRELFDCALNRGQGENVIEFIYEMDKQSFEMNYVLPHTRRLLGGIDKLMRGPDDGLAVARYFLRSIEFGLEDLRFIGWNVRHDNDSRFLFNVMSLYPELNLVSVFLDLDERKFQYRNIPLDVATLTRSFSETFSESMGRKIGTLKFTSSAESWFRDSDFQPRILALLKALRLLERSLSSQYSKPKEGVAGRFAVFGVE